MTRKLAAYAAGLLACSSFTAPAAFAQDGEMLQAPETDDNVIIVTATRRAQDVQDIPLAVTAVSPQQLDNQGVDNIQEVVAVAPSLTVSNAQVASGSVVLRIRGIGTTSNNIGFESAVGIFIDGTYQSRPGVALAELVDLERVEVLRGPQGTTFGRNTSAGALNVTTRRPDLAEVGGFINAGYGNFDEVSLQGAVNVPIVEDALALRVTGAYRERDGFITLVDETGTPFDDSNDQDQWLVRAQLGFETEGGIRGRIIGDYSKSTSSCCSPIELYQSPLVTGGAYAAVGLGANGGNGQPAVATSPFDTATFREALDNRVAAANFAPIVDVDNWGITGEVEFPVSDSADLIFIGSYRDFASNETYDSDFTALDIFNVDLLDLELETITAELRLQGEAFEGKLNYIIGGFFSDEQIDQSVSFSLGSDYDANVGALLFVPTGGAFGAAPLQTLSGGVDPAGTSNTNRFQQSAQSYSVFTHNTFEVFDGFELTLGARYSWEEKEGSFTQTALDNQLCPAILGSLGAGAIPAGLEGAAVQLGCFGFTAPVDLAQATQPGLPAVFLPRTFEADFSDEELIYTIRAAYEFGPAVNAYASFTHGYKAGGINLDTTAAVNGADPTFLSEEVDAFEVGLKTRFLDNAVTFNLAAFYEEFQNFQVLEFTGTAFQTFNVPIAETRGVEIESLIRPNDELTFNIATTILEASYPDDCAGAQSDVVIVAALCGFDLTNAPQVVALFGGLWEKPISDSVEFFVSGQIRIESDQRTSTQALDTAVINSAFVAAAGGVEPALATAREEGLIVADVQDGNEFINLRAGLRFNDGAFAIEGFVNNLTDNVARGVTFNTTVRGGGGFQGRSRSAFPTQPRTYGAVFRAKF